MTTKARIFDVKFCPNCGSKNIEHRRRLYDERDTIPSMMVSHPEHIDVCSCYKCEFGWKINYYDNLKWGEFSDE